MVKYSEQQHLVSCGMLNVAHGPENGPPLILIHGVTRRWQCLLPVIEAFANRWQVFAIDLPGHGRSSARCEHYRVMAYADVVDEWLRSRFQQPIVCYGHSLGAMVAAEVAARDDSPVDAVILEDPPFHTMGNRISQTPLLSYFQGLKSLIDQRLSTVAESVESLSNMPVTDPATGRVSRLGAARSLPALRFMATCLAQLDPTVLEPIVRSEWLDGYDVDSIAQRVHCPVLLLQADGAVGGMLTDNDVQHWVSVGREVSLLQRAGVGHLMHWAALDWLAHEVTLYLESLSVRLSWPT